MIKFIKITFFLFIFLILFSFIDSIKIIKKDGSYFIKKDSKFLKVKKGIKFLPFKKIYSFKNKTFSLSLKDKLFTNGYEEINSSINIKYKIKENFLPEVFEFEDLEDELKNYILNFSTTLYPEEFNENIFKEKLLLFLKDRQYEILEFHSRFAEKDIEIARLRREEIKKKEREPIFTLFIGLDALDWKILEPLLQENKCPNFKKLIENGTYGEILSEEPMLSPILWTTIATGKSPQHHKILEFTQKNESGEEMPITSNNRKCKAIWNILSEVKRNVAFLCWWVTDPPEWVNGILVSDKLSYQLFGISQNLLDIKKFISPFSSFKLNLKLLSAKDIEYETINNIINIKNDEYLKAWEEFEKTKDPHKNRINHLRAILASTINIHNITLKLLKDNGFSLIAPYFEGTDTAAHRFAQFLPPKLDWVKEEDFNKFKDGLFNFYIFIDDLIGQYLKIIPEDGITFIASDHGFQSGGGRPKSNPEDMALGAPEWHRKVGVYIISGKDIFKGKGELVSLKDIAPTILYLQGLPIPEDMEGKVILKPFQKILNKRKIEYIKTYESSKSRPEFVQKISKEEVEERLKELKALGYIGGIEEKKEKTKESFTFYYNLANSYKFQGKRELAKFNYQKAVEVNPSFGLGYFELASILSQEGDHQSAYENLKKAITIGKAVPAEGCIFFVDEALKSKNLKESIFILEGLFEKYKNDAQYYSALGISYLYLKEIEKSKEFFKEALRIDPYEIYAIEEMFKFPDLKLQGLALKKIKEAAYQELEKEKNLKFGKLCFEIGLSKEAKTFIEKVYKESPEDPEALYLLGSLKVMEKNFSEGFILFEKALKIEPSNPNVLFNYGAALVNGGKLEKGFFYLQKAKEIGYNNPMIIIALAKTAFRLNKREVAKNYLEEALKYNETKEEANQLLKFLK